MHAWSSNELSDGRQSRADTPELTEGDLRHRHHRKSVGFDPRGAMNQNHLLER